MLRAQIEMAEDRIKLILDAIDNTKGAFQSVSNSMKKLVNECFNPCFNGSISETAIILKSIENSHSNIILEMPIFVENHISFVLKMSIFPNFYIKPCGENH